VPDRKGRIGVVPSLMALGLRLGVWEVDPYRVNAQIPVGVK
jgi:hypothetical protein